jgi:uncharacterized pyridoxamine 5'-phosphate oxidase family protein
MISKRRPPMKEVIEILTEPGFGSLATIEEGRPRVRPFAFMFEENGRFYFCTSRTKDVYRQLLAKPLVEYTKTTEDMRWLRIGGEIRFDEDISRKERCFQTTPMLKDIYQTPENPDFKIFYLEHGNAAIDSFAPEPRKTYEF